MEENGGMPPAYCAYHIQDFTEKDGVIEFQGLEERKLPDFLEGPVRYLKLPIDPEKKQELYRKVKASGLYDPQLHMYKVNAPLTTTSHEIGRARAFSRGWLENESIWLHMEYKYLLELLKSGMYEEFFEDLKTACIPFLDYDVYRDGHLEKNKAVLESKAVRALKMNEVAEIVMDLKLGCSTIHAGI